MVAMVYILTHSINTILIACLLTILFHLNTLKPTMEPYFKMLFIPCSPHFQRKWEGGHFKMELPLCIFDALQNNSKFIFAIFTQK